VIVASFLVLCSVLLRRHGDRPWRPPWAPSPLLDILSGFEAQPLRPIQTAVVPLGVAIRERFSYVLDRPQHGCLSVINPADPPPNSLRPGDCGLPVRGGRSRQAGVGLELRERQAHQSLWWWGWAMMPRGEVGLIFLGLGTTLDCYSRRLEGGRAADGDRQPTFLAPGSAQTGGGSLSRKTDVAEQACLRPFKGWGLSWARPARQTARANGGWPPRAVLNPSHLLPATRRRYRLNWCGRWPLALVGWSPAGDRPCCLAAASLLRLGRASARCPARNPALAWSPKRRLRPLPPPAVIRRC